MDWPTALRTERDALLARQAGKEEWDAFWQGLPNRFPELTVERLSSTLHAASGTTCQAGQELQVGTGHPFATLHAARDAARSLHGPVQILVHEGRYEFAEALILDARDAHTQYQAAPGEEVVLSAGRRLDGRWETTGGMIWHTDLPAARNHAWPFRQLFVNGRREPLARFPNRQPDPNDDLGWLRVQSKEAREILAGLQQDGDWVELAIDVPTAGVQDLWLSYATEITDLDGTLHFRVGDQELRAGALPASGSWRKVTHARIGAVDLATGRQTIRIAHTGRGQRIHLDRLGLGPADEILWLSAADPNRRLGGESSMGFQTFAVGGGETGEFPADRLGLPPGIAKPGWGEAKQAEVNVWATWGWYNLNASVTGVEPEALCIGGTEAASPIWPGNRFFIYNLLDELDEPGEWFLDYASGRLHYWPRPGEDPNESEFVAPALDRLVEIRADHVSCRGFTFEHTDWTRDQFGWRTCPDAAIHLVNAWHCTVADCQFRGIGGYAVRLYQDSCLNRVAGNHVQDAGGGGVSLTGAIAGRRGLFPGIAADDPAAAVAPLLNLVCDNHVHHCGVLKKYVAGIHADPSPDGTAYAPGNVLARNLIHDLPRNGIFLFSNCGGTVIEHNRIENVLLETDDGGPIHLCSITHDMAPGIIQGNLLRHGFAYRQSSDARMLAMGVYLDDYTSHVSVRDNVIIDMAGAGIFYHHGKHNVAENNLLVDCGARQFWQTLHWEGNVFRHNIVAWRGRNQVYAEIPGAREAADPQAFGPNLLWPPVEYRADALGNWQAGGLEAGSQVADPRFLDSRHPELGVADDSPAHALGFRPIIPRWPAWSQE